ncbi:MAG: hypothetical protein KGL63_11565 [Betaproteobacteria bacterium]|nr:hypothetical protein [Betaproteobacteria bacterium]
MAITFFPGSPDDLLDKCKGLFPEVLVVGFHKDESYEIEHSNIQSLSTLIGILERAKTELIHKTLRGRE